MVDDRLGADLLRLAQLGIAARSGDDAGADGVGDLYREAADTAAGGHHQHRFPRPHAGAVDQHLIGRQACGGQRSGLIEGTGLREVKGALRRRQRVFRVAAGAAGDHPVAGHEALDLRADFRHLAGDVAPQNLRRCDTGAVRPLPHENVQAVQRRGADADQHVVRPRPRRGQIPVGQHLRRPRLFDINGFHDARLPSQSAKTGTRWCHGVLCS